MEKDKTSAVMDPNKYRVGCLKKKPHQLNEIAIYLAGLAEILQQQLDNAQHTGGIEDALNLSWAYKALGQMANDLAEQIAEYDV